MFATANAYARSAVQACRGTDICMGCVFCWRVAIALHPLYHLAGSGDDAAWQVAMCKLTSRQPTCNLVPLQLLRVVWDAVAAR
jgi:hypothetical protein